MIDRTVRMSVIDLAGRQTEVDAGDRTATLYCRYGGREIVVMPDVDRFHLQFGDPDSIHGLTCLEIEEDGTIVVRSNDWTKRFEVKSVLEDHRVEIRELDTPEPGRQNATMAP